MSIKQIREESKPFEQPPRSSAGKNDLLLILMIVFISFASFGLGRLSASHEPATASAVSFEEIPSNSAVSAANTATAVGTTVSDNGTLVASKSGTKYHFPWCPGAQRIKESNKIWFNSVQEARDAGYTPASNCKGLE